MPMEEEPIVGAKYEDAEGRILEVVAFDEDDATVDIRYEDETVDTLDLDAWYDLDLQRLESDDEDEDEDYDEDEESFDDEDEDDDLDDDDDEDMDDK